MTCLPLKLQSSYILNDIRPGRGRLRVEIRHVVLRMCVRSWPAQMSPERYPRSRLISRSYEEKWNWRLSKKVRRCTALKQTEMLDRQDWCHNDSRWTSERIKAHAHIRKVGQLETVLSVSDRWGP